jgi:hypothetical protein
MGKFISITACLVLFVESLISLYQAVASDNSVIISLYSLLSLAGRHPACVVGLARHKKSSETLSIF